MVSTPAACETRIDDMGKAYNFAVPKVYSIDGITPIVHPSAFVHPSAVLVGDVIVGARAYIGPCACLRGDFGRIVARTRSSPRWPSSRPRRAFRRALRPSRTENASTCREPSLFRS